EAKDLDGRAVVAFAGIGRPAKFFDTLRDIGCRVVASHAFADHHIYQAAELVRLADEARAAEAQLVTTAKDAERLPPDARDAVRVLTITLEWEEETALDVFLAPVLRR
ncbi:MAG: tetraacyldisaccharide 4'-kinase, partial [Rhodospirillales bacterium]|nr:tetraacyldisaccharide 4'-kinase [Rhodospirillales bacterium]